MRTPHDAAQFLAVQVEELEARTAILVNDLEELKHVPMQKTYSARRRLHTLCINIAKQAIHCDEALEDFANAWELD